MVFKNCMYCVDLKCFEFTLQRTVSTVVLKTRVHCEGCAHKMKKIVGKSQGKNLLYQVGMIY